MPSTRKLVVIVAAVFVVLAIVLAIAARAVLGGDAVRATIEQQASAALGQPVAIEAASPRIFPRPAIHLTGVSIGAGREVTIERASLVLALGLILATPVAVYVIYELILGRGLPGEAKPTGKAPQAPAPSLTQEAQAPRHAAV